jgi:hypothetical protein
MSEFKKWMEIALRNPCGQICPHNVTGEVPPPNVANHGAWKSKDHDIYSDILNAICRLPAPAKRMIGSRSTLEPVCLSVDEISRTRIWELIAPFFWMSGDTFPGYEPFIEFDDSFPDGSVIVIGKDGSAVLIDTR